LEIFLKAGATPNTTTYNGSDFESPLGLALRKQRFDLVELLVSHNANMYTEEIFKLIRNEPNFEKILAIFFKYGFDVNKPIGSGWNTSTLLHYSVATYNKNLIKFLLDNGADK
jgi:ankyrin repeat protein